MRELQEAIKARHVDEEYGAQVERLENTIRKFNRTWGTRGDIKAVLIRENLGEKAISA